MKRLSYLSDDFIIISVRQLLIVIVIKKYDCLASKKTLTKTELSPHQMFPPIVNMQSPSQDTSCHSFIAVLFLYTVLYKVLANRNLT